VSDRELRDNMSYLSHKSENWKRIGVPLFSLACSLFAFMWPSLYNGQPFFFYDTASYIRGADGAIAIVTGVQSQWTRSSVVNSLSSDKDGTVKSLSSIEDEAVHSGRSVSYGVLLYFGDLIGQFWASVLLQAVVVMVAIGLTLCETFGFRWKDLTIISVGLAVTTPVAFYISFLMPDIFAGITILALANIFALSKTMVRLRIGVWTALLCASVLFHSSHLLIVIVIVIFELLHSLVRRKPIFWKGFAVAFFAIIVGFAGEVAFELGVQKALGTKPIRPPYIMARLMADGPGSAFLKERCPGAGYTACRFVDLLPVKNSENFLWSLDPKVGGFMTSDPSTRRALGNEQYRFALAVLAYDPINQILASSKNIFTQLCLVGLENFNYSSVADYFFEDHLPSTYMDGIKKTRAWQDKMPIMFMSYVNLLFICAGALYVLWHFFFSDKNKMYPKSRLGLFTAIVFVGLFANAAICGALCIPDDRYQARVIWLLPFVAALLYCEREARIKDLKPRI
jgi:hypothetical protein